MTSNLIYQNARQGVMNQYLLAGDYACDGDIELAAEHFKAAALLESLVEDFIPCLPEEL